MVLYSTPFFFNDTATTEIYTLSLHDALPICHWGRSGHRRLEGALPGTLRPGPGRGELRDDRDMAVRRHQLRGRSSALRRSEEYTSELQSRQYLVCRLLLEKKKRLPLRLSAAA